MLAIVLQTQRIRESDVSLKLLTEVGGRISCVARGAQKSKQRFPGGIDLWDSGFFEFEPKRGNFGLYLDSISDRERWPRLRESLSRFSYAALMTELILRLTEEDHQEDGELCRPFLKTLAALSRENGESEQISTTCYFLVFLLRNLGYDICENEDVLRGNSDLAAWARAMMEQNQPIVPFDPRLLEGGFLTITNYCESLITGELRSKHSAQERVLKLRTRGAT